MRKSIAVAAVCAAISSQALALNDREQGILAGIASLWLYQKIEQGDRRADPAPVINQPRVYHHPREILTVPTCRTIITLEMDNYGNTYRRPVTICN